MATHDTSPAIKDIPVICKFLNVFPEDLPNLSPDRDVEFAIEVLLGTTSISRAP